MKKSKFPYLVLTPMLLLLTVFVALPIIASFVISFMDYNPLRSEGNALVGFKNFIRLFQDEYFIIALKNTFYFTLVASVINLILSVLFAQLLCSLHSNKSRSLFRVLLFMPCVAPLAASAIVWARSIFPLKGGLLNMALGALGMAPVNWLGSVAMVMPSIIAVTLWADLGYNIVLLISGIEGIPGDFYEAAQIDGAGALRRFFQITLPLLSRTLSFVILMTIISYFQAFAQFSIMVKGGGVGYSASVLSTFIYEKGFTNKDMGYASAVAVVLFIIVMVVTMVQRRMSKTDWGY